MDKRIELYWVEKYPNLFPGYHMTVWDTPMARGFTCGNGWFHILDKLWPKLAKIDNLTIGQVKEKLAGLRIYQNAPSSKEARKLIQEACLNASEICEMCGEPGSRRGGSWLFTLCDECEKNRDRSLWKASENLGNKIAKDLGLRTTCKTEEEHLMNFDFTHCIVCDTKYHMKGGGWEK